MSLFISLGQWVIGSRIKYAQLVPSGNQVVLLKRKYVLDFGAGLLRTAENACCHASTEIEATDCIYKFTNLFPATISVPSQFSQQVSLHLPDVNNSNFCNWFMQTDSPKAVRVESVSNDSKRKPAKRYQQAEKFVELITNSPQPPKISRPVSQLRSIPNRSVFPEDVLTQVSQSSRLAADNHFRGGKVYGRDSYAWFTKLKQRAIQTYCYQVNYGWRLGTMGMGCNRWRCFLNWKMLFYSHWVCVLKFFLFHKGCLAWETLSITEWFIVA